MSEKKYSIMEDFCFKEEIRYIDSFCKENNFELIKKTSFYGGESDIYEFKRKSDGKIFYGKKFNIENHSSKSIFINPYREFLLECNIKSYFSIQPAAFYIENDESFYIIMEIYKSLINFFYIHKESSKKDKSQLLFDKYLNILLVAASLLQAVLVLHVQKIPIIHHDLKPGNILMSEYKYDSNTKTIVKINIEDIITHTPSHIYFAKLIDYGLTKENNSETYEFGTNIYRSGAHYLESSDIFSVALTLKLLLHNFISKKEQPKIKVINLRDAFDCVFEINDENYVDKFYYRDTKELKGLDRVINIMINLYYKRSNNIFYVLDILTNRQKMTRIIIEDLTKLKNNFAKDPEFRKTLIDKYFEILDLSLITYTYNDEFIQIAPKIFGEKYDYKAFLFTLFHQKNNEFEPKKFQSYQGKIVNLYKESKNKYDLFNNIANYHIKINFFSFEQLFTKFSEKILQTSVNPSFTVYSKLFKILTSLNFRETRSLNHFTNALHLSLFSVKQEVIYNFLVCFGQDYEAKIGFLLRYIKVDNNQDPFEILIKRTKFCNEKRLFFFDEENIFDNENSNSPDINSNSKSHDTEQMKIKFNKIKFDITALQLIKNSFEGFLEIIKNNNSKIEEITKLDDENKIKIFKDECIRLFNQKISINKVQNDNLNKYLRDYNDDAKFLLFIHYLYFFEIKDENLKLKSSSGDNIVVKSSDDNDDGSYQEKEEEEEEWEIEDEKEMRSVQEICNLKYECFYSLEDSNCKEKFIWLTLFRLCDLIDDILSEETIRKLQNYIPVVKFLGSVGINIVEFHIFLDHIIKKNIYGQFQRIAHNYCLNHKINPVASKLQFLESISYFSIDFFDRIFDKISSGDDSIKDLIEFISLDKNTTKNPEIKNYSDIRTKINFPYVIYPFGKINYNKKKSIETLKISDPTLKSKITVCFTHTLNYLTNLPFKIPIQIKLEDILVDEKNGLPIIILGNFDQDTKFDFYNYEIVFDCLKQVVMKFFINNDDNNFLNIINNYIKISNFKNMDMSVNTLTKDSKIRKNFILYQYIFNLFLDPDSLDLTFKGTDLKEFKRFINNVFKNEFYDNHFQKFAYELLGQSYAVKLDYLFTRMKLGSNLTKEKFVDELNEITSNSSLLTLMDDTKTLADLSNLFERYFIEDSYNLVHRLNQLVEKNYKVLENKIDDDSDCLLEYNRQNLNEETISYIYHINNNFVSPMIYSTEKNLYFKVSKMKYNLDDIIKRFDDDYVRSFNFYYSLKSAIYYLHTNCESKYLLPKELQDDDIYINEIGEVMVLPYNVNDFIKCNKLEKIKNELKIDEYSNSIICYSYAYYIPLANQYSNYLMKIFGFDYSTELNEIINSALGFEKLDYNDNFHDENSLNDEKIIEVFNEKCQQAINENKNNIDKHILELSSDTNKLTPLFIHLLEKAKESKDAEISKDADKRLKIYMSIKEIKEGLDNDKSKIFNGGESIVSSIYYNGKKVAIAEINQEKQCFLYLQKMKNTLYLLRIEKNINDYIINEIGFTNFGMIMDLYRENLSKYINRIKDDLLKKPLELFKIILRIIQIICFLHSKNLVHLDIKLNNFLVNSENKIFMSDMLNVQKEFAFNKVTIFTPKYHSKKLGPLWKHQDVYAFETLCLKLFKFQNKNGIFIGYSFPLIDEYIKNSRENYVESHNDIDKYRQIIISEKMYILKFKKEENDEERKRQIDIQCGEITKILVKANEITKDEKTIRDIEINDVDSFENAYKSFTKIFKIDSDSNSDSDPEPSKFCYYLTIFAHKLHSSHKILENNEHFKYIMARIDKFIKKHIDDDNKDLNFDSDLDELIYERIYMREKNSLDDDCWSKIKHRMLKYIQKKKEFDEQLYEKIKYIISVLDKNKDMNAGFFYYYLLSEKKVSEALKNDIDIKKNAICFFYNYYANIKKTININDFEKLISEIYEFLISNPSKIDEFKIWLIGNSEIQPQNINIISMFFYFYLKYQIQYGALNSVFDDAFYEVADKLRLQSNIEIQPVNTYNFLIEAIDFTKNDGEKLACIYKKYVLPSNDDA